MTEVFAISKNNLTISEWYEKDPDERRIGFEAGFHHLGSWNTLEGLFDCGCRKLRKEFADLDEKFIQSLFNGITEGMSIRQSFNDNSVNLALTKEGEKYKITISTAYANEDVESDNLEDVAYYVNEFLRVELAVLMATLQELIEAFKRSHRGCVAK